MVNRGSEWRRWEPHIHAPGTILNNQFGGANSWDQYLAALENSAPRIRAIAVTDYYVTDTYEEVLRHTRDGRLPDVELFFPNVELRLDVAAKVGLREPSPSRKSRKMLITLLTPTHPYASPIQRPWTTDSTALATS